MTTSPLDRERGTAVERTVLAWNRAAVAVAANGALLARAGFVHQLLALEAVGFGVTGVGAAVWALSLVRYPAVAGRPAAHLFARRSASALPAAAFVFLLSALDLVVVVGLR